MTDDGWAARHPHMSSHQPPPGPGQGPGAPCPTCPLHAQGRTDEGNAYETARAHRITLGMLNGAGDATALIAQEIGACHPCTSRFASLNAGMTAALFIAYYRHDKASSS